MTARTDQKCSTSATEISTLGALDALLCAYRTAARLVLMPRCSSPAATARRPAARTAQYTNGRSKVGACLQVFRFATWRARRRSLYPPTAVPNVMPVCMAPVARKKTERNRPQLLMTAPKLVWPKVGRLCFSFARTKTAGCREPINIVCEIS